MPANRNGPEARTKETKFFFCSSLTFISIVKIEFFFLFIFVEQQHKTKTNFAGFWIGFLSALSFVFNHSIVIVIYAYEHCIQVIQCKHRHTYKWTQAQHWITLNTYTDKNTSLSHYTLTIFGSFYTPIIYPIDDIYDDDIFQFKKFFSTIRNLILFNLHLIQKNLICEYYIEWSSFMYNKHTTDTKNQILGQPLLFRLT